MPAIAMAASLSAIAPIAAHAQPAYTVSAEQLQQAVAERFPVQYPVQGLVNLNVQAPALRLLPQTNRLGAEMAVDAAGPALRNTYSGIFDIDFALRYEASDQSIRANQIRINSLRMKGLPPVPAALLESYAPQLGQQTWQEVTLHKLKPQDLALADTMGLEPGAITVTDKGLKVEFVNKKTP